MMASNGDRQWPSHEIVDIGFVESTASLTVMCNYVRFDIEIDLKDLEQEQFCGKNQLAEEFVHFRDNFDEEVDSFEDWAVAPCLEFFERLAPAPQKSQIFTIEDYYRAPTYLLRLKNSNGNLTIKGSERLLHSTIQPRSRLPLIDSRLAIPALERLPRIPASELELVQDKRPTDFEFCAIPKFVRNRNFDPILAFKENVDDESFFREIHVYLSAQESSHCQSLRLPKLYGLVSLDNSVLGFVTEYIEHDGTLQYHAMTASLNEREKWFHQVNEFLRHLHQTGSVWGDVKPDNVLIDSNGDARVIDFGGGSCSAWVDEGLAGTEAGDLQGL